MLPHLHQNHAIPFKTHIKTRKIIFQADHSIKHFTIHINPFLFSDKMENSNRVAIVPVKCTFKSPHLCSFPVYCPDLTYVLFTSNLFNAGRRTAHISPITRGGSIPLQLNNVFGVKTGITSCHCRWTHHVCVCVLCMLCVYVLGRVALIHVLLLSP